MPVFFVSAPVFVVGKDSFGCRNRQMVEKESVASEFGEFAADGRFADGGWTVYKDKSHDSSIIDFLSVSSTILLLVRIVTLLNFTTFKQ